MPYQNIKIDDAIKKSYKDLLNLIGKEAILKYVHECNINIDETPIDKISSIDLDKEIYVDFNQYLSIDTDEILNDLEDHELIELVHFRDLEYHFHRLQTDTLDSASMFDVFSELTGKMPAKKIEQILRALL